VSLCSHCYVHLQDLSLQHWDSGPPLIPWTSACPSEETTSGEAVAERPPGGVGGGVACTEGAREAVDWELVSAAAVATKGPASRSVGAAPVSDAAAAAADTSGGCRMMVAPSEAAARDEQEVESGGSG